MFFRYFADKREALFGAEDVSRHHPSSVRDSVAGVPESRGA